MLLPESHSPQQPRPSHVLKGHSSRAQGSSRRDDPGDRPPPSASALKGLASTGHHPAPPRLAPIPDHPPHATTTPHRKPTSGPTGQPFPQPGPAGREACAPNTVRRPNGPIILHRPGRTHTERAGAGGPLRRRPIPIPLAQRKHRPTPAQPTPARPTAPRPTATRPTATRPTAARPTATRATATRPKWPRPTPVRVTEGSRGSSAATTPGDAPIRRLHPEGGARTRG